MPFDLDQYPYLKRILDKTYGNNIVFKNSISGAHDTNWFKEYELFYSKQLRSAPYVMRVFFKANKKRGREVGFTHIRPISDGSKVCETYLMPPKNLSPQNKAYIKCLAKYDVYDETVECVPYIMPETTMGMCIHASIWICLKILERRGMVSESLCIPEVQRLITGTPFADQRGFRFAQAARLIRMCGPSAFYVINRETNPYLTDSEMLMELYAYVESSLPVVIGVDIGDVKWWETSRHGYHSIVAIGHTMEQNKIDGFIFHDESTLPYQKMTKRELLDAWHVPPNDSQSSRTPFREMLVAVPPEVTLPFHKVYPQFETILRESNQRGITTETAERLVVRPMLRQVAVFFLETIEDVRVRKMALRAFKESNFPNYLWVFYLYGVDTDRKNAENAKGFFLRDATGQTYLRFLYLKDEKQAIYQVRKDKVYRLREGSTRREEL